MDDASNPRSGQAIREDTVITFAIGDIHGMHGKLMLALEMIEGIATSGCRVVFLGDYIDRGPDSRAVLSTLMKGPRRAADTWICLKGNHEDMMLQGLAEPSDLNWWLDNGGHATLQSFGGRVPDNVLRWCRALPLKFETATHFFVHAGIDPSMPLGEQDGRQLMWIRGKFLNHHGDFEKHVVHGHTPAEKAELWPNRTNLDSGAVYGGKLSIGMFEAHSTGSPQRVFTV